MKLSPPKLVYLGDDTSQEILGECKAYIQLPQDEIISICNILYIPNLEKNLFFVKHLDDDNGNIHIRKDKFTLKDSLGSLIAICYLENDLYKFGESHFRKSEIVANPTKTSFASILWHCHFGHISTQ